MRCQIACTSAALESAIAAADDAALEALVLDDQLPESTRAGLAEALSGCGLSAELITGTVRS